jgi:hypothetical protein
MSGFTVSLFHALDSADRVAIDNADIDETWCEPGSDRRRLTTAADQVLLVDDQEIRIDGGSSDFLDTAGHSYSIRFWVEKELEDFDLLVDHAAGSNLSYGTTAPVMAG